MIGYKKKEESKLHLLSETSLKEIDVWIAKYPVDKKQSAVMSALRIVQDQNRGFLTEDLMDAVAEYLDMRPIAVYEVATFYSMYELEPVGKHKICVCTNISCMLNGSDKIVDHLTTKLGIKLGETTIDGRFTLKEVECLGACVNAPMFQIGDTYYENLSEEKVDQVLADLD
jgi:NADH-quinone oxidoreductase subunit E